MNAMKRLYTHILMLMAAALVWIGCVRETFRDPEANLSDGKPVECTISFGVPRGPQMTVSAKGELGIVRESNIFNLYLMIFDSAGKKIYGHYFNGDNLRQNAAAAAGLSNWWQITNMASPSDSPSHGTLHIKTSSKTGCTVVAIANLNPNDLDISSGLLSTIQTYSRLSEMIATQVRSEVAANSGYFMMTGQVTGVNIEGDPSDGDDISHADLVLKRLYSKITFNVRIKEGSNINSFVPDKWQVVNVPTCCYLMERDKNSSSHDAADADEEFFSTDSLGFETETLTSYKLADDKTYISAHSFTFYMMENRNAPHPATGESELPSPFLYKYRELQEKNNQTVHYSIGGDPVYCTATNGDYVYADKYSTYVVISGKLVMDCSVSFETSGGGTVTNDDATLDATVRYVIHLGNFSADAADFNTERNHNYIYNILINGANSIQVEVDANDGSEPGSYAETEPGATGRVVVAQEQFYDSDCHYSTQVISFHAAFMDPENISWYVETPFNPNGIGPEDVNGDFSQIDYKWVEFRLNNKDGSGKYTDKRVKYRPHDPPPGAGWEWPADAPMKAKTMYVDQLVDYLKDQKIKFDAGEENDFDTDAADGGPKITVTAFIDEFYYTKHPISNEYDPSLWKLVVNHPMRRLHILASSARSADGESTKIGSSFTIQQHSIQSIYAVHEAADLHSAWGMEFTDDNLETGQAQYWKNKNMEDCGNSSPTNGRLNTMKLWGILNPDGSTNSQVHYWSDYMDVTTNNETPQLWSTTHQDPDFPDKDYNYLRWSCLTRNRDNNGNDRIDPDEIRWYMASDIQLIGVFLGSYGIEGAARLYQRSAAEQASGTDNVWRQHIVASNRYIDPSHPADNNNSNLYARVLWAEEGITGSSLKYTSTGQTKTFSTRCVRNLGYYMDGGVRRDITDSDPNTVEPQHYIDGVRKHKDSETQVTSPYTGPYDENTFYTFDCSRINLASIREPVDHELVGHDEFSKMACLSLEFETLPYSETKQVNNKTSYSFNGNTYNLKTFKGINDYLDACFGGLDTEYMVCPKGYRLPNIRELAVMWNTIPTLDYASGDTDYLGTGTGDLTPARTHWSKGPEGNNKVSNAWGWGMFNTKILMAAPTTSHFVTRPRCVKDL